MEAPPEPRWPLALALVANYLEPKNIAIASCVSKQWSFTLSSDLIWEPLCTNQFIAASALKSSFPSATYRHLYGLGFAAHKRYPDKLPVPPRISLHNIIMAVDLRPVGAPKASLSFTKRADEFNHFGFFTFQAEVEPMAVLTDDMRLTWNIVLDGVKSVFTMMLNRGGRILPAPESWLSCKLPAPACGCYGAAGPRMAADMKIWVDSYTTKVVERVSLGMMSAKEDNERITFGVLGEMSFRFVPIPDALRYLQHFLLPCGCCHCP